MIRDRFPAVAVALFCCALLRADGQTAKAPRGSVVSGHATCADTNAPARFAHISLNALRGSGKDTPDAAPGGETDLNGNFRIEDVRAGRYLVLVELPGYISGITGLDREEREHLQDADPELPADATILDVSAGVGATVEVSLERGAAVSGTVRYDDGSPAIGIQVALERKNSERKWEPLIRSSAEVSSMLFGLGDGAQTTDSSGHFRLDGLPAGDYFVHVKLSPKTITLPISGTGAIGMFEHPGVSLNLYNGDVFWRHDAKPLKVGRGEEVDVDMTVPIGKLLEVTGTVAALSNGHSVNLGSVTMQLRDDPDESRQTQIEEDGRFHFSYVPPGDYIFRISNAADGPPHELNAEEPKPTHRYGTAEISASIAQGNTQVNITVPERPLTGDAPSQSSSQ